MNTQDIYPKLAVWIRGNYAVWPGIVTKIKKSSNTKEVIIRGYLHNLVTLNGFMVVGEVEDEDINAELGDVEVFCLADELEPRNPNNLDEIPPLPLESI